MKNTIPEVDAYIARAADFAQPILRKLRHLFHQACPEIQESIKWSSPFFELQGIVGNMTAFRQHVSYGFWKAALMSDPEGILETSGNTRMAVLKATSIEDLPDDAVLIRYIKEAVELNEMGVRIPRLKPTQAAKELLIPDFFMAALGQNEKASDTFERFSHSNRKDYVEWVAGAKRAATRDKRMATAVEWLAEGKPRNWKYMKDWR